VLALEDARDREQVFELLLRAARSKTRFAALLSVHSDHIRGRRALAEDGLDWGGVEALRIARDTVPAFEAAVTSRAPSIGSIATGEPFIDGLLEQLGGAARIMLVLPVTVGSRTAALLVAHRGDEALTASDVEELFPLVTASDPALVRVLRDRAKTVAESERADTEGYEVEVSYDGVAGKRAALAKHRQSEAWPEVADALRELVRDGMMNGDPTEDEQLDLLIELGRIEAERLGQPNQAIAALRSAQAIDGGDTRVLDALESLFVAQARWSECIELLEKRLALTEGKRQRIAILLNLATIAHERIEDDDLAIEAYERVLGWDPRNEVASRELEKLYETHRQWEPLAALLLDRASRDDDPAALESVAQLYADKVGDPRNACHVWLAIYRREPGRPHVLDQLDLLAPAANAWEELVGDCSALAVELEGKHPEAAASVWNLVGRWLRDRLSDSDGAIRAFDRALRLQPADVDLLFELLDLLRAHGKWPELVALLSQRVEAEPDPGRQSELYAELGEIYENHLGEPEQAVACYERALAGEPESSSVMIALHRVYLATEAWGALGELLPRLTDALAPTAPRVVIVDLHVELGTIRADHLGLPDAAAIAFREALELDPGNAAAFAGLERVYATTGETVALLDAREANADGASRDEQLVRYAELAAAWHAHKRFDRAAGCWRKLIALEPRDLEAHRGLTQTLRDGEQWRPLVLAQHAMLKLIDAPADRVTLLLELAITFEARLDDTDGAIAAYREAVAVDPHHRGALDSLARLHDRAGRAQPALDALQQLLDDTTTDLPARADLLQRIGHVHLTARDAVNARLSFVQALALDLDNARAREGMARVHIQQGELVAAGEQLIRAAQLAGHEAETVRLLVDAAWLYRYRLEDNARARECLVLILDLDPEHADAKQALAELLHDTQQWESLWPHLEQEVARASGDDVPAAERHDIYTRAARCAVELANLPTAIELFDAAAAIDPRPETLLDRADALYRNKALEPAADAYQALVGRLERPQLKTVYRRLAAIHTELGKLPQAQLFHHKVLDIDPQHRDTLADLTELNLARGHYDEAIATLRSLAALAVGAERAPHLERIGDLYRDKLANRPRAMSTYLEALELDGSNRRILQRILDLQSEAGQWKAAVETIARFLEHETDPARRAAYFLASAEIRRGELKDKPGALEHFEHALDELLAESPLSPTSRARALDAFRAIEELVTADENWKYLEQSYRRILKRLPAGDPSLVQLWHSLGEIYRTRLVHHQSAIEAFEIAHALDPDKSTHRTRLLAELYAATGAKQPQATSERAAKLVVVDPTNPDAYRALGRTAFEAGRIDEAWCVARALVFLKLANSQEQALYRQYQANEVRKATGILDEDSWSLVRHPDEDRTISSIFAHIWEGAVALRAGPTKSFELKAKERMPVEHDTRVVAKIFRHASRLVNISLPDVYIQPRRAGRLLLANCIEKGRLAPAVIVGRDLMTGYRDTEIAASVGAMLALLRPAYYLKLTLATLDELEAALAAAAQLVGKKLGRPELEPLVSAFVPEIQKRLTRPAAETVLALVNSLGKPDLARWRNAVDATAQRAGLLVAGELAATARMISSESTTAGGMRPAQRVQELIAYSVSPSYFAVRQHLGLAVA
jgi:tetratricopeptide (TPR) repeat protein